MCAKQEVQIQIRQSKKFQISVKNKKETIKRRECRGWQIEWEKDKKASKVTIFPQRHEDIGITDEKIKNCERRRRRRSWRQKNIYNKKGMSVTISIKSDKALGNPELSKELETEEELQLLGNECRRAEAIKRLSKK